MSDNRAAESFVPRRISSGGKEPACHHAGFFVAGSDTHESVVTRKGSHRTKAGQSQLSYVFKEETQIGSERNDPNPSEGLRS